MKGDFSRFTFKALKRFSRVLKQQGRVELDADWNEDAAIQAYLREAGLADVIGQSGAPGDGFLVTVNAPSGQAPVFRLTNGRFYVDGIMVANDTNDLPLGDQPYGMLAEDLSAMKPPALNTPPLDPLPYGGIKGAERLRTDLIYLDVWEQHITALEDTSIREIALGGPDTTTRLQTRWRVRYRAGVTPPRLARGDREAPARVDDCDDPIADFPPTATGTGRLTTHDNPGDPTSDPCIVEPDRGGYRGLENRLYRIEIHKGGDRGTATYKWSSENGAVVYAVEQYIDANRLKVTREGRDAVLRLSDGQAVEIYSADDVRFGRSGVLTRINGKPNDLEIALTDSIAAYNGIPDLFIRRWDDVAQDVDQGGALGDSGIEVEFSTGTYRVGDYWTFAARARNGSFETIDDEPPHGVAHHYARLALVHWWAVTGVEQAVSTLGDCRNFFPPLTKLTQLFYVSGDGQETLPGDPLPRPLVVRVNNGSFPVVGIPVHFIAESGVLAADPTVGGDFFPQSPTEAYVLTTVGGLASVTWTPDANIHSQQVFAALWEQDDLQVRFNATLSTADKVAYQPGENCDLEATNVQDALDELCRRRSDAEPGMRITGVFWERIRAERPGGVGEGGAAPGGISIFDVFDVERAEEGRITALSLKAAFADRMSAADLLEQMRPAAEAGRMTFLLNATTRENRIELGSSRFSSTNLENLLSGIRLETGAAQREPVVNDAVVDLQTFMRGLVYTLDQLVSDELVNRATCYLTLEVPQLEAFQFAGYMPLVLRPQDGFPAAGKNEIHWRPSPNVGKVLPQALLAARRYEEDRVLVRLMLKGNFIYDRERKLYLDGEAFGLKDQPPHDLLPLGDRERPVYSGNERRGGDFEMWVWVTEGELPPEQDDIGFVLARSFELVMHNVLSLALNRDEIQASGLLPDGYQVDSNAPFDVQQARVLLRERGLRFVPFDRAAPQNLISAVGYVMSLEPVVMELIRAQWVATIVEDNVEFQVVADDELIPRLHEMPFAAVICRRSQLDAMIADGIDRYDPDSFTVL
ncbi:MAG: hypothetical protein IAE80_08910 [Anaerolinea sp.]|nr:hypothetical protein [Anaerolinea sp.]